MLVLCFSASMQKLWLPLILGNTWNQLENQKPFLSQEMPSAGSLELDQYDGVAVQELKSSFHNGYVYIYIYIYRVNNMVSTM